jgi:hypothetical protein
MYASPKVLINISNLIPDDVLESMGQDLLEGGP